MADLPLATDEMRRQLALSADRQYGIDPGAGNERGYAFNQWMPFSTNRVGSPSWVQQGNDPQWAVPQVFQGGLLGVAGMADAPRTGKLTPEALGSLLTGSTLAGGLLAPEGSLAAGGAIKAYHGSPHDFDRFSFENIGTGEGAQAYGHGLYFAGNEDVAKSYKLVGPAASRQMDVINGQLSQLAREMDQYRGGTYNTFTDPKGYDLKAQYDALMQKKMDLGHMYEVNINADPAKFLDWDKPLSQQHPQVQEAFTGKLIPSAGDVPGSALYTSLSGAYDKPALSSEYLANRDIPGVRYLDQGSRGRGEGSSNYVVFPTQDEIIQILRKYGLMAPAPVAPVAQGTTPGLLSDRQSEVPMQGRVY